MDILYLFGFSERMRNNLQTLLPLVRKQKEKGSNVGFVLIHDGVIGTTTNGSMPKTIEQLLELDVAIFAMVADMKARGLPVEKIHTKIRPVEYSELVDILDGAQKIISWM